MVKRRALANFKMVEKDSRGEKERKRERESMCMCMCVGVRVSESESERKRTIEYRLCQSEDIAPTWRAQEQEKSHIEIKNRVLV